MFAKVDETAHVNSADEVTKTAAITDEAADIYPADEAAKTADEAQESYGPSSRLPSAN